jgi:DNA replication protein DnaC
MQGQIQFWVRGPLQLLLRIASPERLRKRSILGIRKVAAIPESLTVAKLRACLVRRLKNAKLRTPNACVEEIDYRTARGLDKGVIRSLTQQSAWVGTHENIFVLGPTGVGKSFVACALAQKACRDGYSALYTRAQSLFRDLAMPRADGTLRSLLARFSRIDVLVIDDWAMAPLSESERRDFWEICEDRYLVRSTVLTSQLPVSRWHEQIGDLTLADGILESPRP